MSLSEPVCWPELTAASLGPFLLGIVLALALYGVELAQMYHYLRRAICAFLVNCNMIAVGLIFITQT